MKFTRQSVILSVAALPFAIGVTPALAATEDGRSSVSADRLRVDTDIDVSDGLEDSVLDVRLTGTEDDGERFGIRSRNEVADLDQLGSDTRVVSEDGSDGLSTRAILDFNDVDDFDTDLDLVIRDDQGPAGAAPDGVTGAEQDDETAEETFADDSRFVFGN